MTASRGATPPTTAPRSRARTWGQTAVRWVKFNVVGGIGILVQLATLALLTAGLHFGYLAATALAVEAAIVHNFLWHERFTWADRKGASFEESVQQFLRFNLTTGSFSILGNLAFMRLFVGGFHLNFVLGNLLTIASCSMVNFALSDRFVFREERVKPCAKEPVNVIGQFL